jgi:hypothetical protein
MAYSFQVVSVDAWAEPEGGWYWNNQYKIGEGQLERLTPRLILRWLRQEGFLTDRSIGKVQVEDCDDVMEIQEHNTGRPILALINFKEV